VEFRISEQVEVSAVDMVGRMEEDIVGE